MSTIRERLSEKAARNRIPIMCAFELLPLCNLKCKMCYVRKSMSEVQTAGGLKDAQWWLDLAKDAHACGLLYPLITGGEPFLHPQFFEIYSGMSRMGLQISINSNGTLIDRATVIELAKDRPVRINMTLYGASSNTYKNLCGDGKAYERVLNAVELLKEFDIPVKFNASITPENVADLEKMISYAKEQNSPIQVATYMFPPIRRDSAMIGTNDRLSPEEAAKARAFSDYLQSEPDWFLTQTERFRQFVPLTKLNFHDEYFDELTMTCRAGLCSFWVDWQGNLINCGMYGSAQVSLERRPFRESWQELVGATAEVRYASACSRCPNQSLCHTCIAMASNECGSLRGRPEYICRMNEALSRYYVEYSERFYPDQVQKHGIQKLDTECVI